MVSGGKLQACQGWNIPFYMNDLVNTVRKKGKKKLIRDSLDYKIRLITSKVSVKSSFSTYEYLLISENCELNKPRENKYYLEKRELNEWHLIKC